jgi:hypothetical protein
MCNFLPNVMLRVKASVGLSWCEQNDCREADLLKKNARSNYPDLKRQQLSDSLTVAKTVVALGGSARRCKFL